MRPTTTRPLQQRPFHRGQTAPGGNQSGNPTKAEFGTRLREMGSELGPPVATAGQTALPAAKAAFGGGGGGGMTFEGLVAKMGSLWGKMEAAIRAGAAGLAAKACKLLLQPGAESKMGYGVGWLAGTITFEVILAVLTAGGVATGQRSRQSAQSVCQDSRLDGRSSRRRIQSHRQSRRADQESSQWAAQRTRLGRRCGATSTRRAWRHWQ